ncbi:MAG: hypothetical protein E5W13_15865 [Mesorhizobium sp.]|nr:MAG: hypothetical protein EOQ43_12860 [Mesorhizobium sp.]TIU77173.1 MAG: hypothetical protein E5W13_15865 [Mesorhizobium sp.]
MTTVWVKKSNIGWLREGVPTSGKIWRVRTTADPFAQDRFRATYAKRAATRLALLFMHVVISKPLRTFERHAFDESERDADGIRIA